jgi:hypothetical protein
MLANEQINGHDPVALIASANLSRRNLSKGQQAMALAMIYPELEKGRRGKKTEGTKAAETAGFSYRRLAEARTVYRHSPELACAVIAGIEPFDAALPKRMKLAAS